MTGQDRAGQGRVGYRTGMAGQGRTGYMREQSRAGQGTENYPVDTSAIISFSSGFCHYAAASE